MTLIRDKQEMWQTVCVTDVTSIYNDEILVINGVEFHPSEKLCEMGEGTLGLLTGMTLEELKKEQVKRVLINKIGKHHNKLLKEGFNITLIRKDWIKSYAERSV